MLLKKNKLSSICTACANNKILHLTFYLSLLNVKSNIVINILLSLKSGYHMLFDEMKKIVSILYFKEPIAYTKKDYNVKNVYTCT